MKTALQDRQWQLQDSRRYLWPSHSKCDSQLPEQDARVAWRLSTGRLWVDDEDVMDSAFVMALVRPPKLLLSFCSQRFLSALLMMQSDCWNLPSRDSIRYRAFFL